MDQSQLNEIIKEKEASAAKCFFKVINFYKVNVLQNDPHPYLPTGQAAMPQTPSVFLGNSGDTQPRRDSAGLGQGSFEQRGGSQVYRSMVEQELAKEVPEQQNFESIGQSAKFQQDQRSDELLNVKEREIARLQEEKKRLEAALTEIRVGPCF